MARMKGKEYAVVLAEYVARFQELPPSILTEESATELMLGALQRDEPISLDRSAAGNR